MDTLGSRLRQLREEKELTLEYVAQKVGTTKVSIGRYEKDEREPKGEMLTLLANFYNVSTDYLLGISDVRTPSTEPVKEQKLSPEVETIAAHLEEKAKNITPHKMKMLKRYIDDLFDEEFDE